MTAPYTDRDGIPLHITPLPEEDGLGARLELRSEPTVDVSAADAPRVCQRILAAAGRDDIALACSACGLAPDDAETGPDDRCRHEAATKIHRRLTPPTSRVVDTASGSASGSPDLEAAVDAVLADWMRRHDQGDDGYAHDPSHATVVRDALTVALPYLQAGVRDGAAEADTDWARLALALIRGEESADVDPDDPGAWEVACASLAGDQGRIAELRAEVDRLTGQLNAEANAQALLRGEHDQARAEVDRLTESERSRPWMEVYTDPDTGPMIDQLTRELAEAHRERDVARAERDGRLTLAESSRLARQVDRYRTAWTSARQRAVEMRECAIDEMRWHHTLPGVTCADADAGWQRAVDSQVDLARRCKDDAATAYGRGAEDMREQAADEADSEGQERLATHIRHLELPDATPETGRDTESESAEPGDEVPTLAELTDRVDAVEDHTDRTGYRIDSLAHEYNRCVELLRTLAAEVMPGDGPTLSARVATLERTIRLAATTAEVCSAEDQCEDRARRIAARLDALENRMLAAEQDDAAEVPDDEESTDGQ
ncbi:hypothetical protein F4561_006591 [Lipingzhangella halophila]|uniref:Uncharacterized protein n=1 Tax=Lipingzhangella halophila TaxID=1783352 RepID=A0A7W7W5X5_9ACTN|nr:hypothetical protein [Lipingzhangella halophila]MBB4935682.1 hypothetical protein [Lipingzhangella halophila]